MYLEACSFKAISENFSLRKIPELSIRIFPHNRAAGLFYLYIVKLNKFNTRKTVINTNPNVMEARFITHVDNLYRNHFARVIILPVLVFITGIFLEIFAQ